MDRYGCLYALVVLLVWAVVIGLAVCDARCR